MIKGVGSQEDIILNVCVSNDKTSKYIKQKLIRRKGETDKSTIIIGDSNTVLSIIYRKISKNTEGLNNIINQLK